MRIKLPVGSVTLTDDDIVSSRALSRRSLLGRLGIGLGLAAAGLVANVGSGHAQPQSGQSRPPRRSPLDDCTDNDGGPGEDPVGRGRNCRTGPRDGPRRGEPQRTPAACTDTDSGANEDPAGRGRSCVQRRRTNCTDRDGGPNADPPDYGTGCFI